MRKRCLSPLYSGETEAERHKWTQSLSTFLMSAPDRFSGRSVVSTIRPTVTPSQEVPGRSFHTIVTIIAHTHPHLPRFYAASVMETTWEALVVGVAAMEARVWLSSYSGGLGQISGCG